MDALQNSDVFLMVGRKSIRHLLSDLPQVDLKLTYPRLPKSDKSGQIFVREGEEVEMNCTVMANPQPTDTTWYKNVSRFF